MSKEKETEKNPCEQKENEILTDDGLTFYINKDDTLCIKCLDILNKPKELQNYFFNHSAGEMLFNCYKEMQQKYCHLVEQLLIQAKENLELKEELKKTKERVLSEMNENLKLQQEIRNLNNLYKG